MSAHTEICPRHEAAKAFQRYVSIIAIDPCADEILLTRKIKGPAHLIGKQTFPGGKVEPTDASSAHAAAREIFEEFGLSVRPQDLTHLNCKGSAHHRLDVFVVIASLSRAAPQAHGQEPVYRSSWSGTQREVQESPGDFAGDTGYLLESLRAVLVSGKIKQKVLAKKQENAISQQIF